MTNQRVLADQDSVEGRLQRGRGLGFLRALDDASSSPAQVVSCVVDDPRWDPQLESRAWFYAALIDELEIDVRELRPAFEGPRDPWAGEEDCGAFLAADVLEQCARRGLDGAVGELRRYLRTGRDLELALLHLLPFSDHPEADGLADDLLDVADQASLEKALAFGGIDFDCPPWPQWRQARPALDRLTAGMLLQPGDLPSRFVSPQLIGWADAHRPGRRRPRPPRPGERGETTEELLAAADAAPRRTIDFAMALSTRVADRDRALVTETARTGTGGSRNAALWALGIQGDDALLDIGLPLVGGDGGESDGAQQAVLRGLQHLSSPPALAWARTVAGGDSDLGHTARAVLCSSGEPTDLPQLRDLLSTAMARHQVYDGCQLVDAVHRLGDGHSVGLIAEAFTSTSSSWLRRRCAHALAALSPTFSDTFAVECLWDCEAETRACGAEHVRPLTPAARARLRGIVADGTEEQLVTDAAATRIAHPLGPNCMALCPNCKETG